MIVSEPFSLQTLKDLRDLPTLPAVAMRAMAVAEDPGSTASDLLRLIMGDPPLAAKVLRVANSVHYHRGHEVKDLQTAIVRLGFANVRNLLMGVSVIRSFNGYFVGAPYTREEFWVHSIAVGTAASRLADVDDDLSSSTAFVAGLLHDLGKLVLDRHLRIAYTDALRLSRSEKMPLFEAERRGFGTDHAAVGGEILALWRFPRELSEPVRWHHDPDRCDPAHRPHAIVLHVADYLCNANRIGAGGNDHPAPPPAAYLDRLGATDDKIEALLKSLENEPLLSSLLPV